MFFSLLSNVHTPEEWKIMAHHTLQDNIIHRADGSEASPYEISWGSKCKQNGDWCGATALQ